MKTVLRLLSLFFVTCYLTLSPSIAQEPKPVESKILEPEYINQFFALNPDGTLKPLEHATPSQSGNSLVVKEERSSIRIGSNNGLSFVVRLTSRAVDPLNTVQLYRFTPQKNQRQLKMNKSGNVPLPDAIIPFDAVKYGEHSFKIIPRDGLGAGEYGLGLSSTQDGYFFGLDAVSTATSAIHDSAAKPTSVAVQEPKLREPEYVDGFYFVDSHGDLRSLQRQAFQIQNTKPGKGGYVGLAVLLGANSSVRFPVGSNPFFILRVASRDVDPATTIQFSPLQQEGSRRQLEVHSVAQPGEGPAVPFIAEKYGDFSFRITPTGTLAPGEYSITNSTKQELFCFGIDGTKGPVASFSEGTSVTEPEYDNKFYALSDGKLIPLERQTLTNDSKTSAVPFAAKYKIFLVVNGATSPVHLSPNTHLVVRFNHGNVDPQTLINLRLFELRKGNRQMLYEAKSMAGFGGYHNRTVGDTSVSVETKPYGSTNSLEIIPSTPLATGQYCFLTGDQNAECFGVSAK